MKIINTIQKRDNFSYKISGIFIFIFGIPVVFTRNIYNGVNLVNGVKFTAVNIFFNLKYSGYKIAKNIIFYFSFLLKILFIVLEILNVKILGLPKSYIFFYIIDKMIDIDFIFKNNFFFKYILSLIV